MDALDHHDDHFFPGCQDIAWDVAGAGVELALEPAERVQLMQRYRRLSRDRTIDARLPCYTAAYLAFRCGYTALAAETLAGTPDGSRHSLLTQRYAVQLRRELGRTPAGALGVGVLGA